MSVKDGLLDTVLGWCRVKRLSVTEVDCEAHYYTAFNSLLREDYPTRPACIRANIRKQAGKEDVTG